MTIKHIKVRHGCSHHLISVFVRWRQQEQVFRGIHFHVVDSGSAWVTCGSFSNKHICYSDKNPKYTDIIVCKDLLVGLRHMRIKHSVFTYGDCVLLDDGFRRGDSTGLLSPGKI